MPERSTDNNDVFGDEGDRDGDWSSDRSDGPDLDGLLNGEPGSDWESLPPSGNDPVGPRLTESERELADELERRRELARHRDRLERSARDGAVGSGGGGVAASDDDAMAIILAARRLGDDAGLDQTPETLAERELIAEALATYARRPTRDPDEYVFYAVIDKQTTNRDGNLVIQMTVPWDHRHEVFRALETMPFAAMITMRGVELPDDD